MDCKIIIIIVSLITFSSNSDAIEFNGSFLQGSFILGKTDPGTKVTIDKKE